MNTASKQVSEEDATLSVPVDGRLTQVSETSAAVALNMNAGSLNA